MNTTITYDMGKLGKFLMGREEGENAYYVLKRDVFDGLEPEQKVKFTFTTMTVINPSYADESIARLALEYPGAVVVDKDISYSVRKVLETIEETRGMKFEYE